MTTHSALTVAIYTVLGALVAAQIVFHIRSTEIEHAFYDVSVQVYRTSKYVACAIVSSFHFRWLLSPLSRIQWSHSVLCARTRGPWSNILRKIWCIRIADSSCNAWNAYSAVDVRLQSKDQQPFAAYIYATKITFDPVIPEISEIEKKIDASRVYFLVVVVRVDVLNTLKSHIHIVLSP